MTLVRVKLHGTGKENDPYRASLPTYKEILSNIAQGYVIALVPDEDLHKLPDKLNATTEETGHGPLVIKLSDSDHKAWHAHLDKKYSERKGEFRPEIV